MNAYGQGAKGRDSRVGISLFVLEYEIEQEVDKEVRGERIVHVPEKEGRENGDEGCPQKAQRPRGGKEPQGPV